MRPNRLATFEYLGRHGYFLTFCTRGRQTFFADSKVVQLALDQFVFTCTEQEFELTAYCFMPDHVHALVKGLTDRADFKEFARLTKQRAGWRFKQRTGQRLWQEGYYEHVVRDEEGPAGFYLYIINNPVKAGLVESPLEYPYWGSAAHTREEMLEATEGVTEWVP